MAKKATICMTTPPILPYSGSRDFEALFEQMKNYWDMHLARVLPDKPDIILLPECCDRFENMPIEPRLKYYEVRGNRMRDHFIEMAKANNCYIAYSAVRPTPWDERYPYRNSTQIIGRDGEIVGIYDKNHLVTAEHTEGGMQYGTTTDVIKLDFADAACAICFDLNFDELLEKYEAQKPNLVLFNSMYHGGLRQIHWAYRLRSYFAGCIGRDESRVLSPFGEVVASNTNYYPFVTAHVNFDYVIPHIDRNNNKFRDIKKKYGEAVTIHDPGFVGCVMLTCNDENMSVWDIVREYELQLMDDYFEESLRHRRENLDY